MAMGNKFPHMVDDDLAQPDPRPVVESFVTNAVPLRSLEVPTEPIGSRAGRRNVRIPIEAAPALKARLETLAFETGLSVAEICRHALWRVVLEAEGNKQRFVERVARDRMAHRQEERP
jgi:hypothetical protein